MTRGRAVERRRLAGSAVGVALAALLLYLATMPPGLTWAHSGADGGDLAMAVALNGVPHPTGYPTYLLLGELFSWIPVGDVAWRLSFMSAVAAASTVGVVAWLAGCLAQDAGQPSSWVALGTGGLLATSPLFWSQAIIVEVYALHALFVALLAAGGLCTRTWTGKKALAVGILLGLGMGNHLSLVLLLPGLLVASWRRWSWRVLVAESVGLFLGMSVYLVLPLRARGNPPVNWGDAATWDGFWWLVSGRLYRHYLTWPGWEGAISRLTQVAALAWNQFRWWGWVPILWGLVDLPGAVVARARRLTVAAVTVYVPWAVLYRVTDWHVYTLPLWVLLDPWGGLGLARLLHLLASRFAGVSQRVLLAALALLLPLVGLVAHGQEVNLRQDREVAETAAAVWGAVSQGALVLVDGDRATFGLGYLHMVQGQRPDVRLVNRTLWAFPWYRRALQGWYGDVLPPTSGPQHLGALVREHANRPIYLVGDRVPRGVRFSPDSPYYQVDPVWQAGVLQVGRVIVEHTP